MVQEYIRPYEISIWTLQDEFITVLKWSEIENKGQIQSGTIELIDDGTEKLEFSVPLYYYDGDTKIHNPLWLDLNQQRIIPNMHKLKVIFNKKTPDEAVYEFLVIGIDESHSNNEIIYDIHCEGLAFHELGKLGYKVSLSADDYLNEWSNWFKEGQRGTAPVENLQYWNDKIFKYINNEGQEANKYNWTYEVQMDWSSFGYSHLRDPHKVYEEEYVSAWNTTDDFLTFPQEIEGFREKWRPINVSESNLYNITQTIAETFGIFCKYKYEYDANYHIVGRKIIYYNNFLEDSRGHIDLTYPYSTSEIVRSIDNSETISKLYVRPVDDSTSDSNLISIMNVEANRSREDYLLNFDYMYETNTINKEQYDEVITYENRMRVYNNKLMALEEKINLLRNQIVDTEAKVTFYTNAIALDTERENNAMALRSQLTGDDDMITIGADNPEMLLLKEDSTTNSKSVEISLEGVVPTSIALYKTINYTKTVASGERLTNPYTNFNIQLDDFGNVVKLTNIYINETNINRLYMVCNYIPKLYYDNIVQTWRTRRYNDQLALEQYQKELAEYKLLLYGLDDIDSSLISNALLNEAAIVDQAKVDEAILDKGYGYNNVYNSLLREKQHYIIQFEKNMGAGLREGYWQPENYNDYGHKYYEQFTLDYAHTQPVIGNSGLASLIWDTETFDEETTLAYKVGAETNTEYYLIVDLSNCLDIVKDHLTDLSFIYYNEQIQTTNELDLARRSFTVGSRCEFGFVHHSTRGYIPVLVLTGSSMLTETQIAFFTRENTPAEFKPFLGTIKSTYDSTVQAVTTDIQRLYSNIQFIDPSQLSRNKAGEACLQYPRIRINSLLFKNSSEETFLSSNGDLLENPKDYYVLLRTDQSDIDNSYYVTPKITTIIKNGTERTIFSFSYALSNSNVSIYLDALEVMKENSRPKVSYSIKLNVLYKDFIKTAYNKLNRIVHINDYELAFNDVHGYISSLKLNLDQPAEDEVSIKNYATKFEDLFTNIVAQTEAMKKNANVLNLASQLINGSTGLLSSDVLQASLLKVDLNYAFNSGKLTIDEKNGIWGVSDEGVVAFRGGGIFTATTKDENDNWQWNTGILPSGINASLITSGQIDTNRIKIYAGDKVKFQLNGQGLFAYKSLFSEENVTRLDNESEESFNARQANYNAYMSAIAGSADAANNDVDASQYVTFNEKGLFLVAKRNALVLSNKKDRFITLTQDVDRVEISWNGLILRNWAAEEVFWADPDTGNLNLTGTVNAYAGKIGNWNIVEGTLSGQYMQLINDTAANSGIFLTSATNNEAKTIQWNGSTQYAYTKENDESVAYYLDTQQETYVVTGNEVIYQYGTRISSVVPNATTQETLYVNGNTGTTATAPNNEGSESGSNYGNVTTTSGNLYSYTVTYVAVSQGGAAVTDNHNNKIVYDGTNTASSSWYLALQAANKTNYATVTYVPSGQLESTSLPIGTILKLSVFKPKFSIYAASGKVMIDNGQLGGFSLTSGELRDGTLRNTTFVGSVIDSSIIKVGNTSYSTNDYGALFREFIPDPNAGHFKLVRNNGQEILFNISDTAYFRSAVSQARVITLDLSISGSGSGASAVAVATTPGFGPVGGYTATRTYGVGYLYNSGKKAGVNSVKMESVKIDVGGLGSGYGAHSYKITATGKATNGASTSSTAYLDASVLYTNGVFVGSSNTKVKSFSADGSFSTSMSLATAGSLPVKATLTCASEGASADHNSSGTLNATNVWKSGYGAASGKVSKTANSYTMTSNTWSITVPSGNSGGTRTITVSKGTGSCFSAGTLVRLADNTSIPIEQITVGTTILSYDQENKRFVSADVIAMYAHKHATNIVDMYFSSGIKITVTDDHPFLTTEGWKVIKPKMPEWKIPLLHEGDEIINDRNEVIKLEKIVHRDDLDITVYNCEIETYHTYLVEGLVVHNAKAATS